VKIETSREDTRLKLNKFVPAKEFWVNGVREPCISTGVKVRFLVGGRIMKNRRCVLINIAIEILMTLFMYFCANPREPATGRVMIFLIGQMVTLLQILVYLVTCWDK